MMLMLCGGGRGSWDGAGGGWGGTLRCLLGCGGRLGRGEERPNPHTKRNQKENTENKKESVFVTLWSCGDGGLIC